MQWGEAACIARWRVADKRTGSTRKRMAKRMACTHEALLHGKRPGQQNHIIASVALERIDKGHTCGLREMEATGVSPRTGANKSNVR